MGFGTLLFGYFLILNLNFRFTDAVAAVIMLYALYKLSVVNRNFKLAAIGAAVFTAIGVYELVVVALEMFGVTAPELLNTVSVLVRYLTVGVTRTLLLLGMRDVSSFVGLLELSRKCSRLAFATVIVHAYYMLMELDVLGLILPAAALKVMILLALVSMFATVILNLTAIFGCYSKICMPESEKYDAQEKRSKFEFVNKFREHQDEKQREYAEYKLEKYKKKAEKAKQKKNLKDENANKQ